MVLIMTTLYLDALQNEESSIAVAASLLKDGHVVALPTETVYGLAAVISNDDAIRSIFVAKGRPADNPLIVHVARASDVATVAVVSPLAQQLMDALFPGPLTLVLPKHPNVSDLVTAGLSTVAVRMPDLLLTRKIIHAAGAPLAAPSANRSGSPSPTTAQHVLEDLDGRIAAVVDAGPCREGLESTVVRVFEDHVVLLRPGACTREAIERVAQVRLTDAHDHSNVQHSPGTRYRHYAPNARVVIAFSKADAQREVGNDPSHMLLLAPADLDIGVPWRPLSGASVYAELRRADSLHVDKIIVHCDEQIQANEALLNRLRKAAEPRTDD